MSFAGINYLAVVIAAVAGFAVGAVWYSFLFQKAWMDAVGLPRDRTGQGMSPWPFVISGIAYILIAIFITTAAHPATVVGGAVAGALLWLGFVVTTTATNYAYPGRKPALTAIDSGHWLAAMIVMGGIIGAFG
jgi:hypothetical protein